MGKKFIYSETTIVKGTGELIKYTKKVTGINNDEDKYYMVFIDHLEPVLSITSGAQKDVLTMLCIIAEYGTNKINLASSVKKTICDSLRITEGTFYNCISKLRKQGVIAGKNTEFILNPMIFWKGSLKDRREAIKNLVDADSVVVNEQVNEDTIVVKESHLEEDSNIKEKVDESI